MAKMKTATEYSIDSEIDDQIETIEASFDALQTFVYVLRGRTDLIREEAVKIKDAAESIVEVIDEKNSAIQSGLN